MGDEASVDQISGGSPDKEAATDTALETTIVGQSNLTGIKKTYLQELKPWSPLNTESNYLGLLLRPWPMIVYPATLYSFLTLSAMLAWYLCIYSTYASVFQGPPYNMSTGVSGLINIPASIGCFIGAYCGGGLTDKYVAYRARKNNGVFEPETRLPALIPSFFLVPVGLLMYTTRLIGILKERYGLGIEHQTSWAVPFIGTAFVAFGVTAIPAITMTYGALPPYPAGILIVVIDSYLPVAGEALLLINGLKTISLGFGFSYGVIPWVSGSGYQSAFGTMAGINSGIMLLGVPLYYFGRTIRRKTANWKVIAW